MAEFNTLPLPEGVTGKDATYAGCGTESGGLYQPYVFRQLTVPSLTADSTAGAVAQALRERGCRTHRPTVPVATCWLGIAVTGV